MKVICIDDKRRAYSSVGPMYIKEGCVYEVDGSANSFIGMTMYYLVGIYDNNITGDRIGYAADRFIPLSDIDEIEFERNYNFQTV